MHGVYAPIFLETTSLPETISNDFSARMHRFLASLTDVRHKMDGKTVLYIPEEKKCPADYNEAIKDKVNFHHEWFYLQILFRNLLEDWKPR